MFHYDSMLSIPLKIKTRNPEKQATGVSATISDRKISVWNTNQDAVVSYNSDVLSQQDYYPFGMGMPGRAVTIDNYRYGFNTQEKEKEITGSNSHTSAEYWMYDVRLGRRWEMDPVIRYYESPYATFGNNSIFIIDPNGADTTVYIYHEKLKNGTYSKDDKIKSDKQMKEIASEMQSIFDKNGMKVKVKVISPEDVGKLKLDPTDAVLSFRNWVDDSWAEGNSRIYGDGSIGIDKSYVTTDASQGDADALNKSAVKTSYNEIISIKAAHEIMHQYLERSKQKVFGANYSTQHGGHDNSEINILNEGNIWRKNIVNDSPSRIKLDQSKLLTEYDEEFIKAYIEAYKPNGCVCRLSILESKVRLYTGKK